MILSQTAGLAPAEFAKFYTIKILNGNFSTFKTNKISQEVKDQRAMTLC